MQDVYQAIIHHPEHDQLYTESLCDNEGLAVMLDIVAENGPPGGLRCAEVGAGTGGLTRRARSPFALLLRIYYLCVVMLRTS